MRPRRLASATGLPAPRAKDASDFIPCVVPYVLAFPSREHVDATSFHP